MTASGNPPIQRARYRKTAIAPDGASERPIAPRLAAINVIAAMRPRQWIKNVLVGAAPLAAGAIFEPEVLASTALAFVVFCLASSGVYIVNDLLDVQADRIHPRKRSRPIAAGLLQPGMAVAAAALLIVAALTLAALAAPVAFLLLMAGYVVVQLSYSAWLKHQAVIDLAAVGSGFLMRAMAGGLAAGVPLSKWFLLVAAFGSLFMVAGKRYSEMQEMGEDAAMTRPVLRLYSPSYLRFVSGLSAAVTATTYSLWAFEISGGQTGAVWAPLSIAPFVLALLRYALDVDTGVAGEPEQVVLADRALLGLGSCWLVLIGLAVFTG